MPEELSEADTGRPFSARLFGGPSDGEVRTSKAGEWGLLPVIADRDPRGGYWPTYDRTVDGQIVYRWREDSRLDTPEDLRRHLFGVGPLAAWPNVNAAVNKGREASDW